MQVANSFAPRDRLLARRSDAADATLDLFGDEPDLARAARDARLGPIGGGTDEIMKEILGKTLGL